MSEDTAGPQAVPEPDRDPAGAEAVGGHPGFDADAWETDGWQPGLDALSDPAENGLFSDEIEDIDASEWDATGIWSDDDAAGDVDGGDGGLAGGLDFPL